jgi:TetR/AcrR family transcriptional regulator, regulator of autoinduction and epiphytic fitness
VNPSSSAPAGRAGDPSTELGVAAPPEQPEITIQDLEGMFALTDEAASDGRVARGQRTRRIVGEALITLLRESDTEPTARAVAERAGVSLRLVFHHFSDLDDLYHYVAALQLREQWSGMPELSPKLSLVKRIERIVSHRAALFEEISPVRRAMVRHMITSPGVSDVVLVSDALLLQSLKATFAPELAEMSDASRGEYLDAMDTAVSWEAWERMRRTSGLQVRVAKRVMARMLAALCTEPIGSARHHNDTESVGALS